MNIKKLIFPLISLIVLTSCDSSSSKPSELFHMHTFNEEWKSDETGHWKETTCEHDIKTNKEDHIYNTKVTEPTYETKGFTTYTCSVCNYSYESDYIDALKHNYSNKWSYDGNKHYHACIDEGYKDLRKDEENHNYNENGICKECTFSVFSLYQDIYNFEYKFEGEDVILLGVKDTSEIGRAHV